MADATDAQETQAQAPPAKKSMLLIIVLSVLIAAGAVGGGAYFFLGQQATGESAEAEKKSKKAVPKAPAIYVKFDPPFVANFEARGMTRFLQVSIEILTRDPATAELIKLHDPMLRNDLLMLLGNQSYETISSREGKERLRNEALETVGKVITSEGGDAGKVEQLYFTSFVMQ